MVHICYIIWKFNSPNNFMGMGGAERQLLKIISNFKSEDIKITVFSKRHNNEETREYIDDNKKIIRIRTTDIPIISMLIFSFRLLFYFLRLNKKQRIDVIHIPLPDLFITSIYFISKILRIPVITRVAADELNPQKKDGLWYIIRFIVLMFMLKLDGIQVLNAKDKLLAKKIGYPENRTHLIPNGTNIPNNYRDYNSLSNNLLYIGAIRYNPNKHERELKNLLYLIESFYEISKKNNKLKLYLVGDGNYRKFLENRVRELGLAKEVVFTGYRLDIEKYHLQSDIFINPSWREGMPNAVVESMAAGLFVVCSYIPQHQYLIKSGYNGMLINHTNKKDLVDIILDFYRNPDHYTEMGKNARRTIIRKLSIEIITNKLLKMYQTYLIKS